MWSVHTVRGKVQIGIISVTYAQLVEALVDSRYFPISRYMIVQFAMETELIFMKGVANVAVAVSFTNARKSLSRIPRGTKNFAIHLIV